MLDEVLVCLFRLKCCSFISSDELELFGSLAERYQLRLWEWNVGRF